MTRPVPTQHTTKESSMGIALTGLAALLLSGCFQEQPTVSLNPSPPITSTNAPLSASKDNEDQNSLAIFEQRILPIMQAEHPSSCAECHLSGVDLKNYVRDSQEETFASLVAAGLVDLEKPDKSKLLEFINRRPEKPTLVSEEIRKQEAAAFEAWIVAAVNDPELLKHLDQKTPIGPQLPVEVIRHARRDRVLASFIDQVWTEVGRCAACHSPDRNQQQVEEHGEQVSWIELNDPQATLDYMVEAGIIDAENPEKSLLLTKPTMQVDHGGGIKMVVGDRSYKQFRRFLDDYAAMTQGAYASADQLPPPTEEVSVVTEIWFKVTGVPEEFDKMLMQVDLYPATEDGWSEFRVATSDRQVFGGGQLWQHSLSLTAPRDSQLANELNKQQLAPGKYLARLYVDQTGKLEKDFSAELDASDLVAEIEFESRFPEGYGNMTVIEYPK